MSISESKCHRVDLCGIHVVVKSNILSHSFSLSHHLHVLQHKNEIIGITVSLSVIKLKQLVLNSNHSNMHDLINTGAQNIHKRRSK